MILEIGDVIAIVTSLVAAVFAAGTYFSGLKHDRRRDTLDAYNQLQKQALDKLYMISPSEITEISKDNRSARYKEVSTYIARIEHFCVGVNTGIYDRDTVYHLAHGFFDGTIKSRILPIIDKKSYNGEEYYENTKRVIEWMNKRTLKSKK